LQTWISGFANLLGKMNGGNLLQVLGETTNIARGKFYCEVKIIST